MNRNDRLMRDALREFPELHALISLRQDGGWRFAAKVADEGGIISIHGIRIWPQEWTDAVGILDRCDAQAVRANSDGHAVWKHECGVTDVIDALRELPPPGMRMAPRLVVGTAAPTLWTPTPRHPIGHSWPTERR